MSRQLKQIAIDKLKAMEEALGAAEVIDCIDMTSSDEECAYNRLTREEKKELGDNPKLDLYIKQILLDFVAICRETNWNTSAVDIRATYDTFRIQNIVEQRKDLSNYDLLMKQMGKQMTYAGFNKLMNR